MNLSSIGAAITHYRTSRGLSPSDLATRAGMSVSTVYRIERSGHLSTEALLFMCDALEITPVRLMRRAEKTTNGGTNE